MVYKRKKALAWLLSALMVLSLTTALAQPYTPGTFSGTTKGHNADLTVEVTFDADKLTDITVISHEETPGIADAPLERIPAAILEGQTLNVDSIAGATFTSEAIVEAVAQAVEAAGGDVEALKAVSAEAELTKQVTELTTDVVVVGAGGAGLAAAAAAHQGGAKVLVLEKLAAVGGSTIRSGGGIAATGTRFQKELNIEDTKQSWMDLWKERQAIGDKNDRYPDYEAVDEFMDEAVVTTEWLVDKIGHSYGRVEGFGMDPVLRLHFPDGGSGSVLIGNIQKYLDQEGIDVLLETPATKLVVNADGAVVGVEAEGPEGGYLIHAKQVILAAGGFAKSEELLEKWVPEMAGTAASSTAGTGSTGDGILMALDVGAELYEDPWVIGLGISSRVPGTASLMMDWTKLYVDGDGKRFVNEQTHYAIATNAVAKAKTPWAIVDSTEANKALTEALEAGIGAGEVFKADTLDELAVELGMPKDALQNTLKEYNEGAKAGKDLMGKEADYVVAVETAPYYAVRIYPLTMGTFGGVKTDDSYHVLKADGSVIEGLFAVGENANRRLYNQVYMSGSAVQFALTSGRIAGETAAEAIK